MVKDQYFDYLQDGHPSIGKSGLDLINQAPSLFRLEMETPRPATDAMIFGSAFHALVLEPEKFTAQYEIEPEEWNMRTNDGKAASAKFKDACRISGKTALKKSDFALMLHMQSELMRLPEFQKAVSHKSTAFENPFFVKDTTEAGKTVIRKCKPDILLANGNPFDLKTCREATASGFRKSVSTFRYHVQAAWYIDTLRLSGIDANQFGFFAVDQDLRIGYFSLDAEAIDIGRAEAERNYRKFKECVDSGVWSAEQVLTFKPWELTTTNMGE